jgi:hypothetical protein
MNRLILTLTLLLTSVFWTSLQAKFFDPAERLSSG